MRCRQGIPAKRELDSMIYIPFPIYRKIIDHARQGAPLEVCGILGGLKGRVSVIYQIRNTDSHPRRFTMDPVQQIDAFRDLECAGLDMVAFYHSHPEGPDCPSPEDIRLAYYPDVFSIIVSLADPEKPTVKAFRISEGKVDPEDLTVED